MKKISKKKVQTYRNYREEIHLKALVKMVMQWLAKNDIEIFNPETKIIDKKSLYDVLEKLFESKEAENILGKI